MVYTTTMEDSIFTKIIRGEIPCQKVYEDDKTLAFLTIEPVQPGHTLVIPKKQIDQLWDLDDDDYQAVMATSKKVAKRLKAVMGTNRVGVLVVGVDVPHVHVHLIPFDTSAEFKAESKTGVDTAELERIAATLAF